MSQARFTQGSLMRHVVVMTLTSGLGLTFTFAIDFLALYWLSRLSDQALTASISLTGATTFATISISISMMIAAIALVSRYIGRGDRDAARRAASAGMVFCTLFLVLFASIALFFLDPFLRLIGPEASDQSLNYAREFLWIVLPSLPLMGIAMMCSGILRAEGDGPRSMWVTLSAGLTAAVLDPIFIVFMGLGNVGAGIVVVLARIVMVVVGLTFVIRKYDLLAPLRGLSLRPWISPFLMIAVPALLTQIASPVGNIILTRFVSQSGEAAMAGWAVDFRLLTLAFGGVFALSGAIGGIIGQNYGAGLFDRVRGSYIAALKFGTIYTLIAWGVLLILRPFVPWAFSLQSGSVPMIDSFIYTAWYFCFVSALYVSNAAFNNLGRPLWSTAMNWFRDGILTWPVAWVLVGMFGAVGAIYTQVLVGIMVGSLSAWIGWRYLGQLARGEVTVEGQK